jgi:hypothetical protein
MKTCKNYRIEATIPRCRSKSGQYHRCLFTISFVRSVVGTLCRFFVASFASVEEFSIGQLASCWRSSLREVCRSVLADAVFCLNSSRIVGLGIATTLAVSAVVLVLAAGLFNNGASTIQESGDVKCPITWRGADDWVIQDSLKQIFI